MTGTLIGLGGVLRSGKDTVADYLVETQGFVKMGMSDPLNDALLTLDPYIAKPGHYFDQYPQDMPYIRYSQLHEDLGYVEAKKHREVRRLLQVLGTEVGRDMIDSEVWVSIMEKRVRGLLESGQNVALTSIRFPNEAEMITRLGGLLVWIDRPEVDAPGTPDTATHSSESLMSAVNFDYTLDNSGTLAQLYVSADGVLTARTHLQPRHQMAGSWPEYDR